MTRLYVFSLLALPLAASAAEVAAVARMAGTYRHTHAYTSGTFTAVHEQYLTLGADGTARIAANAAGSGFAKSGRPAVTHEGTWSVEGKTITFTWKKQGTERRPFLFAKTGSGWTLAIGRPGSRKLWEKTR